MTKQELINELTEKNGMTTKVAVEKMLNDLARIVAAELIANEEITLPGIGKLKVAESAAREGRNPSTGETIHIPAKQRIKFSAVKALKDVVGG